MRENRTPRSVQGVPANRYPYCDGSGHLEYAMKEKLEKYLIIFAWFTIGVFVVFGGIAKFAPSLAFQYPEISRVVLDNLWWLLIISTLIILFVGKNRSKKSLENPNNKFSMLQATLMVVGVGIGMLAIAMITNWFSIYGILGGMIGAGLYAFSNLKKRENHEEM